MLLSLSRKLNLAVCFACVLLLLAAFVLQYMFGLEPCPLCILQRFIFLFLAILLLAAVLHNPKNLGMRLYGFFTAILALSGIWAAGRQVWLEHQPPIHTDICIPGLPYMFSYLPLKQTLYMLFAGHESCGVVKWRLLGLSIANWTLLCFILLFLFGLSQMFYQRSQAPHLE